MRKYNINFLQNFALKKHGKCLSTTYTNSRDKYLWECEHGHTWKASWNHVNYAKTWCPKCAINIKSKKNTRYCIKDLHIYAIAHGGECLDLKYINTKYRYKWRCSFGHIWTQTWDRIIYTRSWCKKCAMIKNYKKMKNL